jgi:hypothetical protein
MGFDDDGIGVGTIPRPVNLVRWHTLEVAGFAKKPFVFHEEPNFSQEDMIELLGGMGMGRGVIARCAHRVHQAALAAVGAFDNHRSDALFAAADDLAIGNILGLAM